MWIPSLTALGHILIVGSLSYLALLVGLRICGVRSLAKLNAFDFAVTVAIGSVLATSVVSKDLSLGGAILAIGMLLALQFLMAVLIRKSDGVRALVTARPVLLVERGEIHHDALKEARVGVPDVLQAARSGGYGDLAQVGAMIMETDGSISVIGSDSLGTQTALDEIRGWSRV